MVFYFPGYHVKYLKSRSKFQSWNISQIEKPCLLFPLKCNILYSLPLMPRLSIPIDDDDARFVNISGNINSTTLSRSSGSLTRFIGDTYNCAVVNVAIILNNFVTPLLLLLLMIVLPETQKPNYLFQCHIAVFSHSFVFLEKVTSLWWL